MSGGRFNYSQNHIKEIIDELEETIGLVEVQFTPDTIRRFEEGLFYLKLAFVYAQRIDWLISGDDGEEMFHKRLEEDVMKIMQVCKSM